MPSNEPTLCSSGDAVIVSTGSDTCASACASDSGMCDNIKGALAALPTVTAPTPSKGNWTPSQPSQPSSPAKPPMGGGCVFRLNPKQSSTLQGLP